MTKEIAERSNNSILVTQGLYCKGYGLVPKLFMEDTRLSVEAKGIYSYISSYAGAGMVAFPSVATQLKHLNMSEKRYRKHRAQLVKYGYITITQSRENIKYTDGTGKQVFANNIYTLVTDTNLIDMDDLTGTKKIVSREKILPKNAGNVENTRVNEADQNDSTEDTANNSDVRFGTGRNDSTQISPTQDCRNNINRENNNINNINKEYSKDKECDIINKENNLSCSSLSDDNNKKDLKETVIPDDADIDKYIVSLMKKDRDFKGLNFDQGEFYNAFIESIVLTQIQDGVEVLSIGQWKYFKKVLKNKIEPLILELKLLGEI